MISDNYIYLTLSNDNILIEQDILMYDLNSIIGSIGGSLGLFVGFSFLQCSRDFVKFIFRYNSNFIVLDKKDCIMHLIYLNRIRSE